MENTTGTDVEMIIDSLSVVSIPQKKGKSTHLRTPPKKQKRTIPIDSIPTDGNTGRETSQIWDHFAKFIAKRGGQENGTSSIEKVMNNVENTRRAIAEFVIIDEQPFKVVEGEDFKKLMAKALPNFELPSRVTVARHCLKIYPEEKEKLKKLVKNQHKKILNFFQTPDHKGETIAKVTLDNASANDAAIKHLKARIDDWKGVILRNEFLHVRCLYEQIESISRIRNAVKYVKSSTSRFASFKSYVEKTKLDTHGLLSLDVETRWNSTNTMLETAVNFEKAFARMYVDDHNYRKYCLQSELKGHPTTNDWQLVKDLILIDMAGRIKVKFDKYWENIEKPENLNMLLFIAIVLNPRYKMRYVNFILSKAYGFLLGKLKADNVEGVLKHLYNHYNYSSTETFTNNIGGDTNMMDEVDDILHSQWEKHLEDEENIGKKSELDQYLMDNVEKPKDFNILTWWKASSNRYPTISKMARGVLSIPVSTVASKSTFSTGGRILDSYRSSLSPKTVEALICTQQWIRSPSKEWKVQDYLEEVQKIEEVEKECPGAPLSID
ncbi:hypothetical protein KY289_018884 [Solanum tuberosum]|nr:hypothetical protein KY289_018884 [Solanum tuberosum]